MLLKNKLYLFCAYIGLFLGCTKRSEVLAISPLEAYGMLQNQFAILVDVRESQEIKGGMAAPALWMPMSKIEKNDKSWQDFVQKLPKDKKIIFYCAGGVRAEKVAKMLAEKEYKTANMGGYKDWLQAALPIKKGEN